MRLRSRKNNSHEGGSRPFPNLAVNGRGIPTMSPGPHGDQAVGTMGLHLTTLSSRPEDFLWAAAQQDKTRPTLIKSVLFDSALMCNRNQNQMIVHNLKLKPQLTPSIKYNT